MGIGVCYLNIMGIRAEEELGVVLDNLWELGHVI
jgi:hypothetical protein